MNFFANTTAYGEAKEISECIRSFNLKINIRFSGSRSDIDLNRSRIGEFVRLLVSATAHFDTQVFFLSREKRWLRLTRRSRKLPIAMLKQEKILFLRIADQSKRILANFTVHVWRESEGILYSQDSAATCKRACLDDAGNVNVPGKVPPAASDPIDAVYTWVNGTDADWRKQFLQFADESELDPDRFHCNDEFFFSLRSLETYAPWIRTIYILSNCRPPGWFVESANAKWVYHEQVIDGQYLPLFNSFAIETFLHLIPGLSDNFLYLNDDFLLYGVTQPLDYFTETGQSVARLSSAGRIPYITEQVRSGNSSEFDETMARSAAMLDDLTDYWPLKLHHHAPFAINKHLFAEVIEVFAEAVEATRRCRLRRGEEISVPAFLYHHYGLWKGLVASAAQDSRLIHRKSFRREKESLGSAGVKFICFNDYRSHDATARYDRAVRDFMAQSYPFKSRAES